MSDESCNNGERALNYRQDDNHRLLVGVEWGECVKSRCIYVKDHEHGYREASLFNCVVFLYNIKFLNCLIHIFKMFLEK